MMCNPLRQDPDQVLESLVKAIKARFDERDADEQLVEGETPAREKPPWTKRKRGGELAALGPPEPLCGTRGEDPARTHARMSRAAHAPYPSRV